MAYGPVNQYLQQVERAIRECDGPFLAELVSFRHPHVQNPRLQDDYENKCQMYLESPYDEMVAAHIGCVAARASGDVMKAFSLQSIVLQSFLKALQALKEDNWSLPVLKVATLDLRQFAISAEDFLDRQGMNLKPGEMLEKAAEQLMSCFRVCVSDSRTTLQYSKRWGTLALVNQLFKIYFKINKLHLCKPLIRAIESSDIKDRFGLADIVTYRYYVGKKSMFDSDFETAAECLEFAFERCHMMSRRNKRLILIYLIPVKMLVGQLPRKELLHKYELLQFAQVAQAVRIYLILEKLKMIVYRNLFKKVYLLLGTHQVSLKSFEGAMVFLREKDIDSDEVQCIVANLIEKSYIRGYISHQHQKLVVSKQNPFPQLSTVIK